MKIKGTCRRCGRDLLVEQVVDAGGRCPWDGEPLQADYAVVLVDTLRDAERAASSLEAALEQLADLGPEMGIDEASVIDPLRANLERLRRGGR